MKSDSKNPAKAVADALYRERVLRARRTPPEERIMEGPRMFDFACAITLAGLRSANPNATKESLRELLRKRLERARKFDEIRASIPPID